MGFLDGLKSIFSGSGGNSVDDNSLWLYVRCRRCKEVIKFRVDLRNDLSEDDDDGYTANKTVVGSNLCFERLEVTLNFDSQRRLIDQHVSRGEFVPEEAYDA